MASRMPLPPPPAVALIITGKPTYIKRSAACPAATRHTGTEMRCVHGACKQPGGHSESFNRRIMHAEAQLPSVDI